METITTNLKYDIKLDRNNNTLYINDNIPVAHLGRIKYELALLGFGRCNLVIGEHFEGLTETERKK